MADNDTKTTDTGALVFSSTVAKQLVRDRFPTTYLGVRRHRPSSRTVALTATGKVVKQTTSDVVYKIVDKETGEERRMTAREKKTQKRQALLEAKKRKQEAMESVAATEESAGTIPDDLEGNSHGRRGPANDPCYVQLQVDPLRLADEISDLRGEREGVPPVYLPPPILRLLNHDKRLSVKLDDDWAAVWATALQASLRPAEETRQKEDLRPMPYRLVPEVWSRLRPARLGTLDTVPTTTTPALLENESMQAATLRAAPFDTHTAAVLQLLHVGSDLHLSCGAKFGCDYLIYDGPRCERHAFAGLRMVPLSDEPTAYNLSGYVRTLNTAGKLALLACVKEEKGQYHVAIIDLALVKIAATTFQKPRKTMDDRLKNLAKK